MAFLNTAGKGISQALRAFIGQVCPVCLAPVQSDTPRICVKCYAELDVWDKVFPPRPVLPDDVDTFYAPLLYSPVMRRVIHQFKYADKPMLVSALTPFLVREFWAIADDVDMIVPVPMHKVRQWKRQYNQSVLLGDDLSKSVDTPCEKRLLLRSRATRPQRGLTAKVRAVNLKHAFHVQGDVSGKTIVLVDDVWTTGSTMAECAKVLKKAGAKRVIALTLCYVEP